MRGQAAENFNPNALNPNNTSIIVQTIVPVANGKFLIGGDFTTVGGQSRNKIARINSDGTLDPTLTSPFGTGDIVNAIALQTDGKIIVGGTFSGTPVLKHIMRLNSDGTIDASFNQSLDAPVRSILPLADGKMVVGGGFVFCNQELQL